MKADVTARAPLRRLGILAGGGSLPREIADMARARGIYVHVVAIEGEADRCFDGIPTTIAGWGQIGRMLAAFRKDAICDLLIVGRVRRPDLFELRPDLGFILGLPEIARLILAGGGDDGVLRGVIRFFERRGLRVVGPADVAPEVLVGAGPLGKNAPAARDDGDIALGFRLVEKLGPLDIGQGVVIVDGRVEAIEAAENTDAMLARVARGRSRVGGREGVRRGVIVKRPKPGQDLRIDLPAVGPRTVMEAAEAGLAGIAVMANAVVAADRDQLKTRLDEAEMFLVGHRLEHAEPSAKASSLEGIACEALAGTAASAVQVRDALKGYQVIRTLEEFGAGRAVVVARGYVLAVEAGEGAAEVIRRSSALRQWGAAQTRKRSGVVVLAGADELTAEVLAAAEEARLAGVAVVAETNFGPLDQKLWPGAASASDLPIWRVGPANRVSTMSGTMQTSDSADSHKRNVRLFVIAGEHSGDALGGKLMAAINARCGGRVDYKGVGGEHMAEQGLVSLFPLADVAVMGPLAILKALPRIVKRVYAVVDEAIAAKPDAVVIIDSPEFTHPIAKRIRRRRPDIPIIDYVSPSVWAWRPGRARKMRAYVDHVMGLLPFEPAAHRRLGGPQCTYVGHPLIERLGWMHSLDTAPLVERLQLDPGRPVLVVLPGSRASEVTRLMQPFGEAVQLLSGRVAPQVIIPVVPSVRSLVEEGLYKDWKQPVHLVESEEDKFRAFRLARAALAASGTVTLELALAGCPMVVAYKVDAVAARLRFLLKVHSVVLANLVLGESAFPEYIQETCTPEILADAVDLVMKETPERSAQLAALARVPQIMKAQIESPSAAAAEIVLETASRQSTAQGRS